MKKNRFLLVLFVFLSCFLLSCGSDDNNEAPTIVGVWTTGELIVETNYPELDKDINRSFRSEIASLVLKREFQTDGKVVSTVHMEGENDPIRKKTENYRLEGDVLFVDVTSLNITTKSSVTMSYRILTTKREVDRKELVSILTEMGRIDPNLLPDNIEGVMRSKEMK